MAYELTYIIRPDMDADAKKALVERFDKIAEQSFFSVRGIVF